MASEAPNGLASLTAARAQSRNRRTMPPPRHPAIPAEDPPAAPPPGDEPSAGAPPAAVMPAPPRLSLPPPPDPAPAMPTPPARVPAPVPPAGEGLTVKTVYLGTAQVAFLQNVRIAALTERVDVSESAVMRFALRRLMQVMTVEQIRDHLRDQPTEGAKTGRKRR